MTKKEMKFLDRAAALAAAVDPHFVRPNPRVGCVISRGERVIGEGAHEIFNGPHAEVNALSQADLSETGLAECTVWATLEPCDDFAGKKTPSCTQRLISLAPEKIVIGALDPQFRGKNVEKLRAAGISVEVVDHAPSRALNPFFAHWITSDRPYVILKLAQSLDGKITAPGRRFISNKKSREKVHQLRAQVSAVLTTTETVFADSPKLTARPVNISRAFSDPDVVMVGERTVPPNFELFKNKDRNYHQFRREDLQAILEKCTQRGIDSLLTEAGAQVCTELLRRDLADEVQLFVAPQIFGKGKNAFNGSFDLKNFHLAEWENLDGDVWMRFIRVPRPAET